VLFVNYKIGASRDEVMSFMKNSNLVADDDSFKTRKGKANMTVKERGERIKMRCRMIDGPTKDNGFLEGTTFFGSVKERDGVTRVRGIIVTAPIYHTILIALIALLIIQCIRLEGINPVPIILAAFSIFMFRDEYRKQGMIKRYIFKALKLTFLSKHPEAAGGRR